MEQSQTKFEVEIPNKQSTFIRNANEADRKEIFECVNAAFALTVGSEGQAFKKWPRLLAESDVEIETFFVLEEVEKENEILGCFKIIRNADEVKIGQLCVWPKYQGYGYGSQMMNFAESTAGAKIAKVSVASCRTPLISFYERRGYKIIGEDPLTVWKPRNFFTRDDVKVLYMEKMLKN